MDFDTLITTFESPEFWDAQDPIEVIETHISRVYLVGDRAYKQKKPVDLGFVDFTTLEKRKHFCEEELRLNRRLAPELYLRVMPITQTEGRIEREGTGTVIDYLVEMRRFDQQDLMTVLEEENRLTYAHMDQLARRVAAFHEQCPVAGDDSPFGTERLVKEPVDGNFALLIDDRLPPDLGRQIIELRDWARSEHARLQDWFTERKSLGRIRECHGDMHLGNMILQADRITIFDCIEFNDQFRWIDTISEVAFCAMDLTDRGHSELAHQFLNSYLEVTGDYDALPGLRYYLAYRALVRAKVCWLTIQQNHPDPQSQVWHELRSYIALARTYATQARPGLIVMRGVSGTGKSFGAEELVRRLGVIRVRSDVERKRLASRESIDRLYSSIMTERTYQRLFEIAVRNQIAGLIVLLDATYLEPARVERLLGAYRDNGFPCKVLELTASVDLLRERIASRQVRGNDPSDADIAILEQQLTRWQPLGEELRDDVIPIATEHVGCWDDVIERLRREF